MASKLTKNFRFIGRAGLTWGFIGIVASLLLAAVEMSLAGFLQILLNKMGVTPFMASSLVPDFMADLDLIQICIALAGIGFVRGVSQYFNRQSSVMVREIVDTRLKIVAAYEMLYVDYFSAPNSSQVQARYIDTFPKTGWGVYHSTQAILYGLILVAMGTMMLILSWKETLLSLVLMMFVGVPVYYAGKRIKDYARRVPEEQRLVSRGLERVFRNLIFIRISKTEAKECNEIVKRLVASFKATASATMFSGLATTLPPFFGIAMLAVIIYVSQTYFGTNAGGLLSFLYLFMRFVQYGGSFVYDFNMTQTYGPQMRLSQEWFHALEPTLRSAALHQTSALELRSRGRGGPATSAVGATARPATAPNIRLQNLSFTWPQQKEALFTDVNFEIRSGALSVIYGTSGSGKSTLLSMILGLVSPSRGDVTIDGEGPAHFMNLYSDHVGYVGAMPYLIQGTLYENLVYGLNREVSAEEIEAVLKQTHMHTLFRERGLEATIREDGEGLSMGQRQRLSLARALLKQPMLLILDEATANLDKATAKEIIETIQTLKKNMTVLFVSHQPEVIDAADATLNLS
ncbi:MAG TPA: ABC transporter ATP-binding protein [Bdellovibrionota bacterium]|jgi:subfamily B ATP-binding cassette protein MsbA|nr:ABC transporter ATP-binding protein [Bdellovibrionota bacterium]